jgi:hypothetical protein
MLQHERGYKGVKNDFGKNSNSINDHSVVIDFSNNSRVEHYILLCKQLHFSLFIVLDPTTKYIPL